MKMSNFFSTLADALNSSERAILDFLSAFVSYAVPVIPAYLTYYHTRDMMNFPSWVAFTAAFVVETLGMASVSTTIKFWRNNQRYKSEQNKAPFALALGIYVMYLAIVLTVNVVLEVVAGSRGGWIIFSIGLFTLLSVPSGVLISIRAQYGEMLNERAEAKRPVQARSADLVQARSFGFTSKGAADAIQFTGERRDGEQKICACGCGESFVTTHADKRFINAAHRQAGHRRGVA